jgi:hypothetical protein
MLFVIAFVVNSILCLVVAHVADQKNRSAAGFFVLSFFCSFLVGILVVMALPIKELNGIANGNVLVGRPSGKICTGCGDQLLPSAMLCKRCKLPVGQSLSNTEPPSQVEGSFEQAFLESRGKRRPRS